MKRGRGRPRKKTGEDQNKSANDVEQGADETMKSDQDQSDSGLKEQSDATEDQSVAGESAGKRARGRPQTMLSPCGARDGARELGERTDKHRDLIQIEKRGRKASGGTCQTETSSPGVAKKFKESKSNMDSPEEVTCKTLKQSKLNLEVSEDVDQKSDADDAQHSGRKKRGRKPKGLSSLSGDDDMSSESVTMSASKRQKKEDAAEAAARRSSTEISGGGDITPRRSGRGSIPNSRYKDMHLYSTTKKQHSNKKIKDSDSSFQKAVSRPVVTKTSLSNSPQTQSIVKKTTESIQSKPIVKITSPAESPQIICGSSPSFPTDKSPLRSAPSDKKVPRATVAISKQNSEEERKPGHKFRIKEVPQGLQMIGRDGIPVVVASKNIIRVPLPDKAADVAGTKNKSTCSPVRDTDGGPSSSSAHLELRRKEMTSAVSDARERWSQYKSPLVSTVVSSLVEGICPEEKQLPISVSVGQVNNAQQTTGVCEEVVETEVAPPGCDITGEEVLEREVAPPGCDITGEEVVMREVAPPGCDITGEEVVDAPPGCDITGEEVVEREVAPPGCDITGEEVVEREVAPPGCDITEEVAMEVEEEVVAGAASQSQIKVETGGMEHPETDVNKCRQDGGSCESTVIVIGNNMSEQVVMVDKPSKQFQQFHNKPAPVHMTKPGYVLPASERKSTVSKVVTIDSIFDREKNKGNPPPVSTTTAATVTPMSSQEGVSDSSSQTQTTATQTASTTVDDAKPSDPELQQPSGVDMILAGSKTIDAADAAAVCLTASAITLKAAASEETSDSSTSNSDETTADNEAGAVETSDTKAVETSDTKADDSKVNTAGTQTPIDLLDREAKGMITPTVYKTNDATLKTVRVSLGKYQVHEDEVGYEGTELGSKPKSEEYILVELPEGAVVRQRYIKSRNKIDDSAFLNMDSHGTYQCMLCNYETTKKANWYKHKKKHNGLREYACTQCDYRAATSSNLKRHMAVHEDLRAFPCDRCHLAFRQKIHLLRHIRYKHEEKQVKCPFCEYICANENPDLKVHIKRRHLPGDASGTLCAFPCEECTMVLYSKKDLKQHMKFHQLGPELKLFCESCSFVTDCESRLRRHVFTHTKEKPFQCGLCDYRGTQKEHVLRHMRSQHNIEVIRNRRNPPKEGIPAEGSQVSVKDIYRLIDKTDYSKDKIFACNHCTMKFSKLINLYKHLHTQHRNIMPEERDDDYSCVVCDFHTNTKRNLLVHMRKHNLNDHSPPAHLYSCVLCRYSNPKRKNLFQHMHKKHHIEIVMKDDGSTGCFVTDTSNIGEDVDQNMLTVGDVVTTTTAELSSQDDPSVHSVISLEDITTIVSPEPSQEGNLIIDTGSIHSLSSLIQHHEAAEAIEGLQALAGQINLADSVIEEVQVMDDPDLDPITMETSAEMGKSEGTDKSSIQLSAEQLLHLTSGDYVEINGEMYKVEITGDAKQDS